MENTERKSADNGVQRRVIRAVDALLSDVTAFTSDLVRERSVQGDEAGAQRLVREQMEALGFDVREVVASDVDGIEDHREWSSTDDSYEGRPNLVAVREGTSEGEGRSLLFNGHVDVVPEGDADQWSFDPFGGAVEDGCVLGRGASDMKGGVASMLFALAALDEAGVALRGDLHFQSVIEEEAGGYGGTLATVLDAPAADAVVIPEPTDFDAWVANDGVSYFRVTVEGRGAHAAETDAGVNAAAKATRLFDALTDLHDERKARVHDPLFEEWHENTVSLNPGVVRAGEWPSSVPDEAVIEGRVSHAPAETREQVREEVEAAIREAAADDEWLRAHPPDVEWFGWRGSSAKISPDEPIVRTVEGVMDEAFGATVEAKGFPGGIDSRFFVNYADTPALCFGPRANNIHGTDEYVEIEDLRRTTAALALVAMEWCGYEVVDE